jgi:hypothetical protein
MSEFMNTRGLRIRGDVVAIGGPATVAEIDVQINMRPPKTIPANRISHYSARNGGSFYGGFEFAVPLKAFKGGHCVVLVTETESGLTISDYTFDEKDYAFEQLLQLMEYGCNVHNGSPIVPLEQNAILERTLPAYIEANVEPRERMVQICAAAIDWLLNLVDRGNWAAAINLLTRLHLPRLASTDAIKTCHLLLRLAINCSAEQRKILFHFVDKFAALKNGDTFNMIMLCLKFDDPIESPSISDLKAQLVRWKFSGRAMILVFEYVELVFGKHELTEFKAWAMQEWIATSKGTETD